MATSRYVALTPIRHNGKLFAVGDALALTDAQAASLGSAIAPQAGALPAMPPDPPVPVLATPSATGMVISDGTKSGAVAGEAGGLTYDAAGRVATYQAFGVTWTITYDASGRVASRTDGTTVQTAQYDSAGRFTGWL